MNITATPTGTTDMKGTPSFDPDAMQQQADRASRLLKAMANPQRLQILCLLVGREMSVMQLNTRLPWLSQSALSQHLARLRKERMVHARRESQQIWYSLDAGPVNRVIETLYAVYCGAPADAAGQHTD